MSNLFRMMAWVLIVVAVAVIGFVFLRKKIKIEVRPTAAKFVVNKDEATAAGANANPEAYTSLRNVALTVTRQQLQLGDGDDVFGLVMDWGAADGKVMTLVCFQEGEVSMYFSNGGGIIGAANRDEHIRAAARELVAAARPFIDIAVRAETFPLPGADTVQFFLRTAHGVFAGCADTKEILNGSSKWAPLFTRANNMVTEFMKLHQAIDRQQAKS